MMQDTRNEDAVIFAEIAEYARGMIAVPKGQEVPFPGLPALLPYKLQRAWQAAEQGEVDLAKKRVTLSRPVTFADCQVLQCRRSSYQAR